MYVHAEHIASPSATRHDGREAGAVGGHRFHKGAPSYVFPRTAPRCTPLWECDICPIFSLKVTRLLVREAQEPSKLWRPISSTRGQEDLRSPGVVFVEMTPNHDRSCNHRLNLCFGEMRAHTGPDALVSEGGRLLHQDALP
jgi:hypothetical protein